MPTIFLNPIQAKQNIEDIVRIVNRNNQRVTQVLSGQFDYMNTQEAAFLQTWQDSTQDDVDDSHPMELPVYIPSETFRVHKCLLRFKIGKFRSTATSATAGDAVSTTSGASSASTTVNGGDFSQSSGPSSTNSSEGGDVETGPAGIIIGPGVAVIGGSDTANSGGNSGNTTSNDSGTSGPATGNTADGGAVSTGAASPATTAAVEGSTGASSWVSTNTAQTETAYGTWGGPGHEHNYYRATTHVHGILGHTHPVVSHYHGLNSHIHTGGSHAHGLNSHTHGGGSHFHGLNGHAHTIAHSHTDTGHAHIPAPNPHNHTTTAHKHPIPHTHNITVVAHGHGMVHTHGIDIPGHNHSLVYGVYEAAAATSPGITVTINTIDRTAVLGGPFSIDQDELDITSYILAGQWNIISIGCAATKLVRIQASVFVQAFIRPVGRLEPEE